MFNHQNEVFFTVRSSCLSMSVQMGVCIHILHNDTSCPDAFTASSPSLFLTYNQYSISLSLSHLCTTTNLQSRSLSLSLTYSYLLTLTLSLTSSTLLYISLFLTYNYLLTLSLSPPCIQCSSLSLSLTATYLLSLSHFHLVLVSISLSLSHLQLLTYSLSPSNTLSSFHHSSEKNILVQKYNFLLSSYFPPKMLFRDSRATELFSRRRSL